MSPEQAQQIESLLQRADMEDTAKEMMRNFFNSISAQPQFDKILSLLNRFPLLFENFCKCFALKREFILKAKSEGEWKDFMSAEDEILSKLKQ